jgi:hypothetical protein
MRSSLSITWLQGMRQVVSVYDVMTKPPTNPIKIDGLNLDTGTMQHFDSGALCPRFEDDQATLRDGNGTLRVTVIGAVGLPVMDALTGGSDSYCVINVSSNRPCDNFNSAQGITVA